MSNEKINSVRKKKDTLSVSTKPSPLQVFGGKEPYFWQETNEIQKYSPDMVRGALGPKQKIAKSDH